MIVQLSHHVVFCCCSRPRRRFIIIVACPAAIIRWVLVHYILSVREPNEDWMKTRRVNLVARSNWSAPGYFHSRIIILRLSYGRRLSIRSFTAGSWKLEWIPCEKAVRTVLCARENSAGNGKFLVECWTPTLATDGIVSSFSFSRSRLFPQILDLLPSVIS